MGPISDLDWMTNPEYFYTVHAHRPFDVSIVNNICKDVIEEDLMGLEIEGLEEVRLFSNEEKHNNNSGSVDLKQWGHFYFVDNANRMKFEKECRNKQHIINDFNLVARQAVSTNEDSRGAPTYVGQSRVTMTSGKRM